MLLPDSANPSVLAQRLRTIRQFAGLLVEDGAAMMAVAGSDGSDGSSNGSHALLHYLLLGRSGLDVLSAPSATAAATAPVSAELDEGGFDEIMLVISAQRLGVYCPPRLRPALEKLLVSVSGLRILSRAPDLFGDQSDQDELFKIHAFLELTAEVKRVIVPVLTDPAATATASASSAKKQQQQDPEMALKMSLESWPIVQASGLDEMGRHGFFTLTRSVAACNLAAFTPLSDVDYACVHTLLTKRVPAFNAQVQATVGRMFNLAAAALESASVVSALSSSSSSSSAAAAAAPRDATVAQVNADLRTFWEYGVESLAGEADRAQRRAADAAAPSGLFFFGASAAAGNSSQTMVRAAGLKHYASLSGYYNKLTQAHPYLPLDPLLPALSSWTTAPLHALLRLTDPLSSMSAVRTVLLRQTTPVQENQIEVLQYLTPAAWKRKKRRLVKDEDEDGHASSNSSGVGSDSGDDDEDEEEEDAESSDINSDEEERKSSKPTAKAAPKPKPAKVLPPRLKTESPGLRDSMLLEHLYAILTQVAGQVLREILAPSSVPSSTSASSTTVASVASSFPSFVMLRDRIVAAVQHLVHAKWILSRTFFEALRSQLKPAGAVASNGGGILGLELYRIDAFGRRTACDLSAPVALACPDGRRALFSFALYLHSIPSMELQSLTDDNEVVLGSVGFGESFVWDAGCAQPSPSSKSASAGSTLSAEEAAEERRARDDPKYFGTGLKSSSAINTAESAAAAAGAEAVPSAASSSMLVLTADIPSLLSLPSFFQLFEAKCVAALVSSYAHASPPPHVSWSAAEVAAKGLVPVHASLGRFLFDGALPKLPSTFMMQPPTSALVGAGARMRLFDPQSYTPAVFVGARNEIGSRSLLLHRNDAWLSSSPLGGIPCSLLLGSHGGAFSPVLSGTLVAFEQGFVFHASSLGAMAVSFGNHVLEAAFYDGSSEEWEKDDDEAAESDESDDEDDSDLEGEDSLNDALFSIDLMEPANATEAASTPYTFLRSLQSSALANLPKLAPLSGNAGVVLPPAASKFAKSLLSLALVLPKSSALAKAWSTSLQARWSTSCEALNIHNDTVDEIPAWCRESYLQLQEQHRFQRREERKKKQQENHPAGRRMEEKEDEDQEDEEDDDDDDGAASARLKFAAPKLVLPDATCDFLTDYRVREQMRDQTDAKRVQDASILLSKANAMSAANPAAAAAIPVSLVVGVPSSGHSALLACVRDHDLKSAGSTVAGVTRWSTLVLGGGNDAISLEGSTRATAAIADLKDRVAAITAQQPQAKQRVLVIVSSYCGVRAVVDWLHSALLQPTSGSAAPSFRLSTAIAMLSACNFFVGPSYSLTYPGVVDQLVAGYTSSCLLLTPPLPLSARETALLAAVRARIRACHPAGSDLRVAIAGARIAFKDVESMLLQERWGSDRAIRRRAALQLLDCCSGSIPRPLSAAAAAPRVSAHLFHFSPSSFLFDRTNFLASLSSFICQRSVYHSDAERDEERKHGMVQLARANAAAAGAGVQGMGKAATNLAGASSSSSSSSSASAASSAAGRIVFTTSSTSLPSSYTVLSVQSLLKFEDAFSNGGRVSHRFLEVHAAQGRVDLKARDFATRAPRQTVQSATDAAVNEGDVEDEFEERKETDQSAAGAATTAVAAAEDMDAACPIPPSALPVDIALQLDSNAASSSASAAASNAPPSVTSSSLSTASTSCVLLVYGVGLSRADVQRDLLRPSLRNARSYEKADSPWNAEVKRQQADIMREGQ